MTAWQPATARATAMAKAPATARYRVLLWPFELAHLQRPFDAIAGKHQVLRVWLKSRFYDA